MSWIKDRFRAWLEPETPPPPDPVMFTQTFPFAYRTVRFMTPFWLEQDAIKEVRYKAWNSDIDLTGGVLKLSWSIAPGQTPSDDDTVTLTVTVRRP